MKVGSSLFNLIAPMKSSEELQDHLLCEELWEKIFSYIPGTDLQHVKLTCKQWKRIASNPLLKPKEIFYQPESLQFFKLGSYASDKMVFKVCKEDNWLAVSNRQNCWILDCKTKQILFDIPLKESVELKIKKDNLFLGANKGIDIWDLKTQTQIETLKLDFSPIKLMFENDTLLFTDESENIGIYKEKKITHLNLWKLSNLGKYNFIRKIHLKNNILSFCVDSTIPNKSKLLMWDLTEKRFVENINIPLPCKVWSYEDNRLVIVNNDNIKIENIKTKQSLYISDVNFISSAPFEDIHMSHTSNKLVIAHDRTIKVWNIQNGELLHTFSSKNPRQVIICANTLIVRTLDHLYLWDISENSVQNNPVCQLKIDAMDMHLSEDKLIVRKSLGCDILQIKNSDEQSSYDISKLIKGFLRQIPKKTPIGLL